MATKKTGISRELIIHPGETIADILEARGLTQTELAARTGVSQTFVTNVISGKKDISKNFAMALEYALGVPKSFWLNLQAKYDAEMLEYEEETSITEEEKEVCKHLNEIVKYLKSRGLLLTNKKANSLVLSLRKIFQVSSLCNLGNIPHASAFRLSNNTKVDPHILNAWIRICQLKENGMESCAPFDKSKINSLIGELKDIMLSDDSDTVPRDKIKETLLKYGIDFEIVKHFRGAPVQGYLYRRSDDAVRICMTIRKAYADIFWFSLFHELGHLVNGDLSKSSFIDIDGLDPKKENAADLFAANALLDQNDYEKFTQSYKKQAAYTLIEDFAKKQHVMPYIVIGRMQKENIIGYEQYSNEKKRYQMNF